MSIQGLQRFKGDWGCWTLRAVMDVVENFLNVFYGAEMCLNGAEMADRCKDGFEWYRDG